MVEKRCNKCNDVKPLDAFEFMRDRNKHRNICKQCNAERRSISDRNKRERNKLNQSVLFQVTEQKCAKCKVYKPVEMFYKDNGRKGGYDCTCIECRKEYRKENEQYLKEYRLARFVPKPPRPKLTLEEVAERKHRHSVKSYKKAIKRWKNIPYNKCKEMAEKCNSRVEYNKTYSEYYNAARINGWLDEFFPLLGYKIDRRIYAYVFPDNAVYVGLTGNHKTRHKDHMVVKSSAVKIHMEETGLEPELNYLTDYMHEEKAAQQEQKYVKRYEAKGYKILNRVKAGGLGGCYKRYSIEDAKRIAMRAKTRKELRRKHMAIFNILKEHGMLEQCIPIMEKTISKIKEQKPSGYWTYERCVEESKKYRSRTHMREHNQYVLTLMQRNGWLDEIMPIIYPYVKKS